MAGKALVLDANILVRAVLGRRTRTIIETYCGTVAFFVPDVVLAEALEHLPTLVLRRQGDAQKAVGLLNALAEFDRVGPTVQL